MKRKLVLPVVSVFLATISCIWPIRSGPARATEVAFGYEEGFNDAKTTLQAELTQEALYPPTPGTVEPNATPTCSPSLFNLNCMAETVSAPYDYTDKGLPTETPIPTPSGPILFLVKTKGGGTWTSNNLYLEAGSNHQYSSGFASDYIVQLTYGVTLPVYETYLINRYYLVVVDGWVEIRDLENAGQDAFDTTTCVYHTFGHKNSQSLCHAHLYKLNSASDSNLIGIINPDLTLQITEVDTQNQMAKVILPPLWIEAENTIKQ